MEYEIRVADALRTSNEADLKLLIAEEIEAV